MFKQVFIATLLSLSSICFAAAGTDNAGVPVPTIIVLPDTFSEGEPLPLEPSEIANQTTAVFDNEWQILRQQPVENSKAAGVDNSANFNDLFSVSFYEFASIIQLRTPRVETILERHVLTNRYIARLNELAQKWPHQFSHVILAGVGRGTDVAQAMLEISAATKNEVLKNVMAVVSIGDRRKLVKLLGVMQDKGSKINDPTETSRQNLVAALTYLDSNMRILNKGLSNLHKGLKPGEKIDRKKLSKIYTYYMLTVLGFIEELAKLQSSHATQTAIKVGTLATDIIKDPEFKGKLLSFMQIWMTNPDEEMALFLIKELTNPTVAQKISDLSEIFSEGKTYKELPMVGRIYYHALKQAISENSLQFAQSLNLSTSSQDPARFFNNLNNHIVKLGAAISDLKKGLLDMGNAADLKQLDHFYHVDLDESKQALDKNLFLKILNVVSGSENAEAGI